MTNVVTKICVHCFSYNEKEHECSKFDISVGNCETCTKWLPKLVFAQRQDVVFHDYKEYDLGDLTDIYNKRWLREMITI